MVLRVYVCFFEKMGLLSHYGWGCSRPAAIRIMTRLSPRTPAGQHDLEIAFKSSAYPLPALIPASRNDNTLQFRRKWLSLAAFPT